MISQRKIMEIESIEGIILHYLYYQDQIEKYRLQGSTEFIELSTKDVEFDKSVETISMCITNICNAIHMKLISVHRRFMNIFIQPLELLIISYNYVHRLIIYREINMFKLMCQLKIRIILMIHNTREQKCVQKEMDNVCIFSRYFLGQVGLLKNTKVVIVLHQSVIQLM